MYVLYVGVHVHVYVVCKYVQTRVTLGAVVFDTISTLKTGYLEVEMDKKG